MVELKRILLAEDNANDVELTLSALAGHNLANEVLVVRNGLEALDYLLRRGPFAALPPGHPAVVLLDLTMPKLNGLDVLKQMRTHPDLRAVPVVMLTAAREEADLLQSYELGANAYVRKPVGFVLIAEAMQAIYDFWFRCSRRVLEET